MLYSGVSSLFLTPRITDRVKPFKDGRRVIAYHQTGTAVGTADGPFDNASIYLMGTTVEDADDNRIADVKLIQLISADGSIVWAYGSNAKGEPEHQYIFRFKSGMGRFQYIDGRFHEEGLTENRVDRYERVSCSYT